tara:strand:+ start:110 stop:553 length:444 start_codon:yes stop_codon:yes gene_type:complete
MAMREPLLSEHAWTKIKPLLPEPRKTGRPRADDRSVIEGILWVLRTGARWRYLPSQYPSSATCWRRLRDWEQDDIWLKIWRQILAELDADSLLAWEEVFVDGSFAPAKKGASASVKPNAARERSGWWWSTAKVFLWEANLPPHRPPK